MRTKWPNYTEEQIYRLTDEQLKEETSFLKSRFKILGISVIVFLALFAFIFYSAMKAFNPVSYGADLVLAAIFMGMPYFYLRTKYRAQYKVMKDRLNRSDYYSTRDNGT